MKKGLSMRQYLTQTDGIILVHGLVRNGRVMLSFTKLEMQMMYKIQYKSNSAYQSWVTLGSYGNESSALSNASRVAGRYFMVRVIDAGGNVIWSH